MKLGNEPKELLAFLAIVGLIIGIFAAALFGFAGLRVFMGIIFASAPFYWILINFNLTEGEKFVLSLMLGLTLFPSLVYLLGFLISFRISIIISFMIFIGIGFLLKHLLKTKHNN